MSTKLIPDLVLEKDIFLEFLDKELPTKDETVKKISNMIIPGSDKPSSERECSRISL